MKLFKYPITDEMRQKDYYSSVALNVEVFAENKAKADKIYEDYKNNG